MKVTLQIKKKYFDLIKSGVKKVEWRSPSQYNIRLLWKQPFNKKDMDGNPDITEIQFVNGMTKNPPKLTIQCKKIRAIEVKEDWAINGEGFKITDFKSTKDYSLAHIKQKTEGAELWNFHKGNILIEISLGEIIE